MVKSSETINETTQKTAKPIRIRNRPREAELNGSEIKCSPLSDLLQEAKLNGEKTSIGRISAGLSQLKASDKTSALMKLQSTHGNRYVQRLVSGSEPKWGALPNEGFNRAISKESNLELVLQAVRSAGQPLPERLRAYFEPRFGYDFRRVRIHTDAPAANAARSVNALAYTYGRNIVFGAGQYKPETSYGKRLLAHELVHVIQQSFGSNESYSTAKDISVNYSRSLETIADQAAETAVSRSAVSIEVLPGALTVSAIQRQGDEDMEKKSLVPPEIPTVSDDNIPGIPLEQPALKEPPYSDLALDVMGTTSDIAGLGGNIAQGVLEGGLWSLGQLGKNFPVAAAAEGTFGLLGGVTGVMDIMSGINTIRDPNKGAIDKTVGGLNVFGGTMGVLGSFIPGLAAGGSAGLGAAASGAGSTVAGVGAWGGLGATLGSLGAVAGAGAAGYGIGTFLAENTRAGKWSTDLVGGIDKMITGEGKRSSVLRASEWLEDLF